MARIAGIVRKSWSEAAASDLRRMRERLVHEPADGGGTWVCERTGVGLAWIVGAGRSDCSWISNAREDVFLLFCGETFAEGNEPRSEAAGSVLRLYEEDGIGFLERLNGGFCGVLVDTRCDETVVFNDRYGTRRICYHQDGDGFYFASEAKALLEIAPPLRRLDARGVGEFLSCGAVLQNRTLFSGISILPPAARWRFHAGAGCERESYFAPESWENQPTLGAREYTARLGETFPRVLPPYLNGPDAVGISLTGGVDSRLILAWGKRSDGTLSCYTFGGPYGESADVRLARQLASACGLRHHTIGVGDEFLRQFPELAEKTVDLSDGAMDVSGAVELYVNRRARQIAPVRLTGNYGSEVLRAHVAFKPGHLNTDLFDGEMAGRMADAATTYAAESRGRRLTFIAFKQVPWHHHARAAIEHSQLIMRSPYLDNALVKLAYQAPAEMADGAHLLQLIHEGNPSLARFDTDRAVRYRPIPVVSKLLNLYQEVSARAEYAYDYGMPQWLAKLDHRMATMHLERLFLGRHKFYHFRLWYRDELADYVRAVLLDPRALQRPYLNGRRLEEIVAHHTAGRGNYTVEIHKLLTLELVQRQLLERH